eukprot:COSAG02_NODE_52895_length_305_cov_0.747573_2_plen_29_part_01
MRESLTKEMCRLESSRNLSMFVSLTRQYV